MTASFQSFNQGLNLSKQKKEGATLKQFIANLNDLFFNQRITDDLLVEVKNLFRTISYETNFLPEQFQHPLKNKHFSQYLIAASQQKVWYLVGCVWKAGARTPVHDHGCWGIVRVLEGRELATTYKLQPAPSESVQLRKIGVLEAIAGDVYSFNSKNDIHLVENPGPAVAISLHLYGKDLGHTGRYEYDPKNGTKKHRVIPYAN